MKAFVIFFLVSFVATAQKTKEKLFLLEQLNLDDSIRTNESRQEEMNKFLGFGLQLSMEDINEKRSQNSKKKVGYKLQVGFQLPKFIKTNPPNKVFKIGWNMGLRI